MRGRGRVRKRDEREGLDMFEGCQARRCSRETRWARSFCNRHWAMLPAGVRGELEGIEPWKIFFGDPSPANLKRIEALAGAIEELARREGHHTANLYRMRAIRWAAKLAEEGPQEAAGGIGGSDGGDFTAEDAEGNERGRRGGA